MSAYAALMTRFAAVTAVTDAVSTRIWQQRAPDDPTLPYMVVHAIGGTPHHHYGGAAVVAEEVYQLDIYAATTASRDSVKEAVRNALDGYRGTVGSVVVQTITLEPPIDDIEGLDAGRQSGIYTSRIDARVFYERAEPTL